jgi:hypothetical protein
MKKTTAVETENRVTVLIKLILSGKTPKQIFELVNDPSIKEYNWEIRKSQFYKLHKKARRYFTKAAATERNYEIGLSVARLNDLYQKSNGKEDLKTCLAIQRELNALLGLYLEDDLIEQILDIKKKLNIA